MPVRKAGETAALDGLLGCLKKLEKEAERAGLDSVRRMIAEARAQIDEPSANDPPAQ